MKTFKVTVLMTLTVLGVVLGGGRAWGCRSDLGCQLNGVCDLAASTCRCDPAWKAPNCSALNLQPTSAHGDLRIQNVSTWGMTVLPKLPGGGEWHGLYAEMTKGCGYTLPPSIQPSIPPSLSLALFFSLLALSTEQRPRSFLCHFSPCPPLLRGRKATLPLFTHMHTRLGFRLTSWETNSRISHAVAPTPNGPWTRKGTVRSACPRSPRHRHKLKTGPLSRTQNGTLRAPTVSPRRDHPRCSVPSSIPPPLPWTAIQVLGVWAHTPSAAVARDGTILLFHMGSGETPGTALPGSREYNASCEAGRSPCGTPTSTSP